MEQVSEGDSDIDVESSAQNSAKDIRIILEASENSKRAANRLKQRQPFNADVSCVPTAKQKQQRLRNQAIADWGITEAEYTAFFSGSGPTGEKALYKQLALSARLSWEEAKELLSAAHSGRTGPTTRTNRSRSDSRWTSYEFDTALAALHAPNAESSFVDAANDDAGIEAPAPAPVTILEDDHCPLSDTDKVERARGSSRQLDGGFSELDEYEYEIVGLPSSPSSPHCLEDERAVVPLELTPSRAPAEAEREEDSSPGHSSSVVSAFHHDQSIRGPSTPPSRLYHTQKHLLSPVEQQPPRKFNLRRSLSPPRLGCFAIDLDISTMSDVRSDCVWQTAGRLTGAAIDELLRLIASCRPGRVFVADTSGQIPSRERLIRLRSPLTQIVLLPLHVQENHWVLAATLTNTVFPVVHIYDSLPGDLYRQSARDKVLAFFDTLRSTALSHDESGGWYKRHPVTTVWMHVPPQDNNVDCGIAVAVAALHVVTRLQLPSTTDFGAWRVLLGTLIDDTPPEDAVERLYPGLSDSQIRIDLAQQDVRRCPAQGTAEEFDAYIQDLEKHAQLVKQRVEAARLARRVSQQKCLVVLHHAQTIFHAASALAEAEGDRLKSELATRNSTRLVGRATDDEILFLEEQREGYTTALRNRLTDVTGLEARVRRVVVLLQTRIEALRAA